MSTLTEKIDQLLPQTQCQQCGFPRCHEYAQALADGTTDINRCPPGGSITRTALAQLLETRMLDLDPDCGTEAPRRLYAIDERRCIGCTLCIQVCPVDAILGSAKKMHSILSVECTGCGLCPPVCPVDCIVSFTHPAAARSDARWPGITHREAAHARKRTNARLRRLAKMELPTRTHRAHPDASTIRDEIAAAVARVKNKPNRQQ